MFRDWVRRIVTGTRPPADAVAALDGGPGPEPGPYAPGGFIPQGRPVLRERVCPSPPIDEEMRAAIRERIAAAMDIPAEWLVPLPAEAPAVTVEEIVDMRRRFDYEVMGRFDRDLELEAEARRDAAPTWQDDFTEAMADVARAAKRWPQ